MTSDQVGIETKTHRLWDCQSRRVAKSPNVFGSKGLLRLGWLLIQTLVSFPRWGQHVNSSKVESFPTRLDRSPAKQPSVYQLGSPTNLSHLFFQHNKERTKSLASGTSDAFHLWRERGSLSPCSATLPAAASLVGLRDRNARGQRTQMAGARAELCLGRAWTEVHRRKKTVAPD